MDDIKDVNKIIEKYMRIAIEEAKIAKSKWENPLYNVFWSN